MPSQITVAVKSLKVTLPLKLSGKSQDVLYDEEILKLNLNNFVVTVQMSKQDDAVKACMSIDANYNLELSFKAYAKCPSCNRETNFEYKLHDE